MDDPSDWGVMASPAKRGARASESPEDFSAWIVGRNDEHRSKLTSCLQRLGYRVYAANEVGGGLPKSDARIAFFIAGAVDPSELGSLREASLRLRPLPVVVVATNRDPHAVVEAVNHGASDYLVWTPDADQADLALRQVLSRFVGSDPRDWCAPCASRETCTMERLHGSSERGSRPGLTGHLETRALHDGEDPFLVGSPAMRTIERVAGKLADSDLTVLIRGASGTGKEVVARHLHRTSSRRGAPFVKVNCAAVPETLLESELFGYERGAFTGAATSKIGRFEEAQGGTILLDEISEMSVGLQAKLLHVLQDKHFSRLGGTGTVAVDTRILATTNRDLEEEVEQGNFREDLYFRLKVIDLYLPPLKERTEEIPLFVDYFCCRFAREYRRPAPELSERLLGMLLSYDWPGNVRELENLVKRAVVLGESSVSSELVDKVLEKRKNGHDVASRNGERGPFAVALKEAAARAAFDAERDLILGALERTRWNRKEAARLLGVSYRTIRSKIKRYELDRS